MFVSLGSIIGSGWLLGALTAAETAGPASIISWILAAAMLATLALVYAELGATYPVAGGSGRFPYYSHGPIVGFIGGWAAWVQAVFIAPIEVLAAITYVNSVHWVNSHFTMLNSKGLLNTRGLVVAIILMILFTAMNLAGAEFMSESNVILVIWKTAVPFLAIGVIASLSFHPGNFSTGGGFMPFGWHGVFAALPVGVVFALQGFEQAVCLAGEARNPRKDLSRAILTAMGIGALLYTLLQVTMIAGLNPTDVAHNWNKPLGQDPSDYGAWYTLALAVGATWLAVILIIDAVISPAGTGIVYLGTSARLSYALGEERELPGALSRTNARGVPYISIIVALVVGLIGFGPFKSWAALVSAVTGATAVMYAMAPIALGSLHLSDGDRPRQYRMPLPKVLLPTAFVSANLILYWGGFDVNLKVVGAIVVGLIVFVVGSLVNQTHAFSTFRNSWWIPLWLGGVLVIGRFGRYGDPTKGGLQRHTNSLPAFVDLGVVIVFSLVIYFLALSLRLNPNGVSEEVAKDAHQLEGLDEVRTA
jgi:amino acid transporter